MESKATVKTTGSKFLSVLGVVLCVILIPLLVVNLTIIIKSFVYPDEVPSFLGYKPFIVLSNSMYPAIETGDIVLVKQIDTSKLIEGDIVSYREGNSVITHRIVDITEADGTRQFITRGDNNNTDDSYPIQESVVEGKLLFNVHKLGNGALFMQTKIGMLLFIVLPLILLVFYDLFRRRSLDRSKKKQTFELEKELERMRSLISATENEEITENNAETEVVQSAD